MDGIELAQRDALEKIRVGEPRQSYEISAKVCMPVAPFLQSFEISIVALFLALHSSGSLSFPSTPLAHGDKALAWMPGGSDAPPGACALPARLPLLTPLATHPHAANWRAQAQGPGRRR
jgi:hypothetical protein